MIKRITPSKIVAEYDGKQITIYGEALLPGFGSSNYIIYKNSIDGWDPPNDETPFSEEDKQLIIVGLTEDLNDRSITFEFE